MDGEHTHARRLLSMDGGEMADHANTINVHQLVIGHLGAITNGQTSGEHIHLGIIAHLGVRTQLSIIVLAVS